MLKKEIKRDGTVILALCIVTVMLIACCAEIQESEKQEGWTSDRPQSFLTDERGSITFPLKEPVVMSMFAIANNNIELNQTKAFEYLVETTNVQWDLLSAGEAELEEKREMLLSTGQYPDVFFKAGLPQTVLDQYGSEGVFIPLNELIETYAPNLKMLMEDDPSIREIVTSADGNIYSLPMINRPEPALPCLFINQTWLDNLGLEEPKSLDEFYEVLKAFKEQDANGDGDPDDEIPLSAYDTLLLNLLPYFGVGFDGATKTAIIEDEYVYVPATEVYKEFLAYCARLYREGLLDEKIFSQTAQQHQTVGTGDDVYGCFFGAGPVLIVGRERNENYPILTPFVPEIYPIKSAATGGTFAITDKCQYPEIAMAWVDRLYSEEGGRLAWMGIEGESYQIHEDGTWEWILNGEYRDITALRQNYTLQGASQMPAFKPDLWIDGSTDSEEVFIASQRNRMVSMGADPFPVLKLSGDDNKIVASVAANLDPYVAQYMVKVITGETDLESSWEEYLETLNKMGLPVLMRVYSDAYQAAIEK